MSNQAIITRNKMTKQSSGAVSKFRDCHAADAVRNDDIGFPRISLRSSGYDKPGTRCRSDLGCEHYRGQARSYNTMNIRVHLRYSRTKKLCGLCVLRG